MKRTFPRALLLLAGLWLVGSAARRKLRQGIFFQQTGLDDHPTALVTGASSGIGEAFARLLAGRGYDLILVARRVTRLQQFAAELHEQYGVAVEAHPADLLIPEHIELLERVVQAHKNLYLLVNNAGYGDGGPFAQSSINRQVGMIQLHDVASVRLTRAVLPGMVKRGRGAIINVSSVASFAPLPHNANYSASKAFLNIFTRAVQNEVAGTGVILQALCPGFTYSEFHNHLSGFERSKFPAFLWMQADDVARQSLDALGSGDVLFVPGAFNRLTAAVLGQPLFAPLVDLGARLVFHE